jgi:hypothetical protein
MVVLTDLTADRAEILPEASGARFYAGRGAPVATQGDGLGVVPGCAITSRARVRVHAGAEGRGKGPRGWPATMTRRHVPRRLAVL